MPPTPGLPKEKWFFQARSQDRWGGGGAGPQKGEPFWTSKVDLLADLGGASYPASPDSCYFILCIYLLIYLFIYLFMLLLHAWLSLLSKSSIYPWASNKKFFRFQRGVNILTPSPVPMPPLHIIHPVMVMVAVKLKLSYTLGPTFPELSILIECFGLPSMH